MTTPRKPSEQPRFRHWLKIGVRWIVLISVLVAVNVGFGALLHQFTDPISDKNLLMVNLGFIVLLLTYAVLLSVPFVPGVEIGVSLLMAHGSNAAPFVYLGTLTGLSLAYGVGVALSDKVSCNFLLSLGMRRACEFVDNIKLMSRAERLEKLEQSVPGWAGTWIVKRRYLLVALLLNVPGNSLIGGGGGIAMLAGLSRTFSAGWFFVTIALATAPVPILVYLFGPGLLG